MPEASCLPTTTRARRAIQGQPWNEIVVDGRGNAYINNVGFDFPVSEFAPGTIALLSSDGSMRQVADGIAFPNGMAVSADNATLIVAESYASKLTAFEIAPDGRLANRRTWADLAGDHPDGICVDADGAVWYADVGNKHCVRVSEDVSCCKRSSSTAAASPACSAARTEERCSWSPRNGVAPQTCMAANEPAKCSARRYPHRARAGRSEGRRRAAVRRAAPLRPASRSSKAR